MPSVIEQPSPATAQTPLISSSPVPAKPDPAAATAATVAISAMAAAQRAVRAITPWRLPAFRDARRAPRRSGRASRLPACLRPRQARRLRPNRDMRRRLAALDGRDRVDDRSASRPSARLRRLPRPPRLLDRWRPARSRALSDRSPPLLDRDRRLDQLGRLRRPRRLSTVATIRLSNNWSVSQLDVASAPDLARPRDRRARAPTSRRRLLVGHEQVRHRLGGRLAVRLRRLQLAADVDQQRIEPALQVGHSRFQEAQLDQPAPRFS